MKHCWVFWGLLLWLMAPCLELTPESGPQEEWTCLVPQHRNCPLFKFGKCGCLPATLNCSSCCHTVREWNWLEECYEKTTGYLRGTKVLWWLGINSVSELDKAWKKLLDVIFKQLAYSFDFYCVPCVMWGNSGLSNINQHYVAFRMNQTSVQHFETDTGSQTTGPVICPRNASDQGSWRQQWLLQLSALVWTSGASRDKLFSLHLDQNSKKSDSITDRMIIRPKKQKWKLSSRTHRQDHHSCDNWLRPECR